MDNSEQNNIPRGAEVAVLAFACVLPTIVTLAYFVLANGLESGVQQLVFGGAKIVQFGLPVFWVVWVCRERLFPLPLSFPGKHTPGLSLGLVTGVLISCAIAGLYFLLLGTDLLSEATTAIQQRIASIGIGSPWRFAAVGVFYALVHSLLEEYYWRWFVFARLRRLMPLAMAIGLSSVAFALHHVIVLWAYFSHVPLVALGLSACVAVGGAIWAWLYDRTGSLYGPWLSHLCVDAAIFGVGYHIARPLFVGE